MLYQQNGTWLITESVCKHQWQILIRPFLVKFKNEGHSFLLFCISHFIVVPIFWYKLSFSFCFSLSIVFPLPCTASNCYFPVSSFLCMVPINSNCFSMANSFTLENYSLLVTGNLVDAVPTDSLLKEIQYTITLLVQRTELIYPCGLCSCM